MTFIVGSSDKSMYLRWVTQHGQDCCEELGEMSVNSWCLETGQPVNCVCAWSKRAQSL